MIFGNKSTSDILLKEELETLSKSETLKFKPFFTIDTAEDNWTGASGLITDVLDRMIGDLSEHEAYLCGSPGMINACIKVLNKHDIKKENVYYDSFS